MSVSALEIINHPQDAAPKLWVPFIGRTNLYTLTGTSDTGKSSWVRQLALSIVFRLNEFLGYPLIALTGRVLLVSLEDDLYDLKDYFAKNLKGEKDERLDNLKVIFNTEGVLNAIFEEISETEYDLVIIDTWSDIYKGNSNSFSQVRSSLNELRELSIEFNVPFLLLHHTTKNSEKMEPDKNRLNGSQAIEAKSRLVLELRNDSMNRKQKILSILKGNKIRNSMKEESMVLSFDEQRLMFDVVGMTSKKDVVTARTKRKFDTEKFREEGEKLRKEGIPFHQIPPKLAAKYPSEQIPGITWFKDNCKIPLDL